MTEAAIFPCYPADMAGRPATKQAPPFGERLAALRKERGLSQEALAAMIGTTRANVAYFERKASNPTADVIQRCAAALGVPVAELMDSGNGGKPPRKPGPASRFEMQLEQLRRLPRSQQQFVSKFLDTVLKQNGD